MWIKRKRENESEGLPVFTKSFSAREGLVKCELAITATGIFSASINGYEIPDLFMPGWCNYLKRVDVCRYDVTRLINENNVISVTVANGWYSGKLGYGNKTNVFGDEKRLFAELTLTYADGEVEKIVTDEDWAATTSDVVFADFFDGEVIDARLRNKEKRAKNAEISDFSVPLTEYSCEPVRVVETLTPTVIYEDERVIRYDFGRNVAGMISLEASGEPGDKIVVKYGETLDENGGVYTENLRRARCTDEFILSGGELDCFKPEFTYHGFRYAEISKPASSRVHGIEGRVISQDIEYYGSFECSDEVINGVYAMARNGQRSNFVSIPTECPQRDERLGWTGDAEVFCNSAMFNADCKRFFTNYLRLIRDDTPASGRIPSIVPLYMPIADNTAGVPGWGDCIAVMPYFHYLHYRDESVIRDNLPTAEKWIAYYINKSENYLTKITNNFGDWLSQGGETDANVINQIFFAYSTRLTASMCGIIGESDKKAYYSDVYEKVKRAFRACYYKNGRITSDTQTAYAFAYAAGLISRDETAKRLPDTVHERGDALTTGFIGSRFILPALCDAGETELAYRLIKRTEYPSWGYMLAQGATTVWERWNGYTAEHGFEDPEMNSLNHYSLGSCTEWLYSYVLGIKLSADSAKTIISPSFSREISCARGGTRLSGGNIFVSWKYEKSAVRLTVVAADGVDYEIDKGLGSLAAIEKRGNDTVAVFATDGKSDGAFSCRDERSCDTQAAKRCICP